MITGYLCALVVILLLAKVIARKSGNQRLNTFFCKIHKPLGMIMIAAVILHLMLTMKVWGTRASSVIITGIVTATLMIFMLINFLIRKKTKKIWFSLHRIGAALSLVMLILHITTYYMDFQTYQNAVASIQLNGVTAQDKKDGNYIGEYDAGYIYAKVEVIVKDEQIQEIHLLDHKNERGKKAENLLSTIVETQNTKVDTVSGATNSSNVIIKAVENALK